MNTNEEIISPPRLDSNHELPAWLDDKLRLAAAFTAFIQNDAPPVSPEFHARCQQAAAAALAQARMRAEHERGGDHFTPAALSDYLRDLAQSAQVSLAPLLARWDLPELGQPKAGTAHAIGQLAKSVGLSLQETVAHLWIGFAQQCGLQGDLQALLGRQRSHRLNRDLLDDYATALKQLEKKCVPASWREFQQIEHEIRAAYEENND
jgi:hypothetical protein